MNMQEFAMQAMKELQKTIASQDRQLKAFRSVIASDVCKMEALKMILKEYVTDEYPGTEKLNSIILECVQKNGGQARLQEIADCIEAHQITLPRNRLSQALTNHPEIKYNRDKKTWEIAEINHIET